MGHPVHLGVDPITTHITDSPTTRSQHSQEFRILFLLYFVNIAFLLTPSFGFFLQRLPSRTDNFLNVQTVDKDKPTCPNHTNYCYMRNCIYVITFVHVFGSIFLFNCVCSTLSISDHRNFSRFFQTSLTGEARRHSFLAKKLVGDDTRRGEG